MPYHHEMRGSRACLGAVLGALLALGPAACGDDGDDVGTGPDGERPPEIGGVYFGIQTQGPFTCEPETPEGADTTGDRFPRLVALDQGAGAEFVVVDSLDPELRYTGSVGPDGSGIVRREVGIDVSPTIHVIERDSLSFVASGSPPRLRATGTVGQEGRTRPGDSLIATCTRPVSWDFTRRLEPVPTQEPIACSAEATLRPEGPPGTVRAGQIMIDNRSDQPLSVYRLDASGQRILMGIIDAGTRGGFWVLDEPITPLVLADAAGACLAIHRLVDGPVNATFGG